MKHSRLQQVIVNADDFGLDPEYNQLTLRAFQRGVISSATLMANMPAFEDACRLANQHALLGRIGLHFNLTYGAPLSQAIAGQPLFCDAQGQFDLHLRRSALHLPAAARTAVWQELQAQWERCLDHGVRPSHIDSHQHVHNIWPIAMIVARFAAQQRVPVRLARNVGGNIGPLKWLFKSSLNRRMRWLSGASADRVCTPRDLLDGLRPHGLIEVVAHPTQLDNGDFGDDYLPPRQSLDHLLDQALPGYQRIAYSDL
ncbi:MULTISPECIES: carbohydrate deacetylase [Pseudomonas]|uniref:ChbG/HpnK family deacetylase n=1 Tax=Pseudomonas sessilinigenes TaxID=658629 RepID=A0ABX8MJ00_9PSED|nr:MULTISPECIES: ChbG/HpnK family deacetylase [Pseudomonas]AZC26743.1 Cellobiose phosphotransferase system YdjC-like protein [Pseudomonas sessilinigenes]QXH39274.1 ChbG/HpnK family deacetylase [Pseudomonas sessilinigenes]UMZ09177.1 ChbG/HpnK family deacetylase [Pseudomonas sp. MPFS]